MMSFVLVTKNDNVIIIDGGRAEDMPLLKEYVAGRHVSAWILTHAHGDHMWGFMSELKKNNLADFDVEKVIYNFPPYSELKGKTAVPDPAYFDRELEEVLADFVKHEHLLSDKAQVVKQGDSIQIDECKIDFIYTYHDGLYANLMNDASLVFKITTPNTSVLFLGDLGPEGGDILFEESRHLLKSDIVQMAHHGHMNVGMEDYAAIAPEICLWCCPDWLYNEPEIPQYLSNRERARRRGRTRMYGTTETRKWMEILGVKKHYVTKDGTHRIEI
jgi:beta-lactamase superfamily II metal-dependent hydrolase